MDLDRRFLKKVIASWSLESYLKVAHLWNIYCERADLRMTTFRRRNAIQCRQHSGNRWRRRMPFAPAMRVSISGYRCQALSDAKCQISLADSAVESALVTSRG